MNLYYFHLSKLELVGFTYACYLSDSHQGWSQMGYIFIYGSIVILWHSMKKIIVATSSNHVEILATHKASRECV